MNPPLIKFKALTSFWIFITANW